MGSVTRLYRVACAVLVVGSLASVPGPAAAEQGIRLALSDAADAGKWLDALEREFPQHAFTAAARQELAASR